MTGSVDWSESVRDSDVLLQIADDELVLGWRDSEWTGIAPVLEEDVAFSSIAQNEIGHARAIYQLLAEDADALAFDRAPDEYRCSQLVELRFLPDWARTIARRVLYEAAAGLAAKIDREEAYHRMHAQMWHERLRDEERFGIALEELWPYALGVLAGVQREALADLFELPECDAVERGTHEESWPALWKEMTEVRRSVPGATW